MKARISVYNDIQIPVALWTRIPTRPTSEKQYANEAASSPCYLILNYLMNSFPRIFHCAPDGSLYPERYGYFPTGSFSSHRAAFSGIR